MKYLFKKKRLKLAAAGLDLTGPVWKLFAPRRQEPKKAGNVLIVRLDHLGDILFTTPMAQLLKEAGTAARVTYLTSSAGAQLLKNNPFIDEVIVFDAPWFSRSNSKGPSFKSLVRPLKDRRFDTALLMRGDVRENWLAWAAGIPERIGYGVTGGGFLLSNALPYRFGAHEREHTLDVLKAMGVDASALRGRIYFSPAEEKTLQEKLTHWDVKADLSVIQLDAGTEAKQWPLENIGAFLDLAERRLPGRSLVFVGSNLTLRAWIDERLKKDPALRWKNLIGATSLRELFWLIKQARAFVGHDSGPTHVAASFGVPSLFLFSGTNRLEEWRSLEESAEILINPVPCSPCELTQCPVPGHPCMAGIAPEKVVRWIEERIHAV